MSKKPLAPKPKPVFTAKDGFDVFKVWTKYEALAMHFNDLLMRLRSQSLGAVATFATAAAVLLKSDSVGADVRWGSLTAVFFFLLGFWIAIWILDFCYYNRLLLGAVAALEEIEAVSRDGGHRISDLNLSTRVEEAVVHAEHGASRPVIGLRLFYIIVCALLFFAMAISFKNFGGLEAGSRVMRGSPVEHPSTKP
jgi:hypothetical protein